MGSRCLEVGHLVEDVLGIQDIRVLIPNQDNCCRLLVILHQCKRETKQNLRKKLPIFEDLEHRLKLSDVRLSDISDTHAGSKD